MNDGTQENFSTRKCNEAVKSPLNVKCRESSDHYSATKISVIFKVTPNMFLDAVFNSCIETLRLHQTLKN